MPLYFRLMLGMSPIVLIFHAEIKGIRLEHQRLNSMLEETLRNTKEIKCRLPVRSQPLQQIHRGPSHADPY